MPQWHPKIMAVGAKRSLFNATYEGPSLPMPCNGIISIMDPKGTKKPADLHPKNPEVPTGPTFPPPPPGGFKPPDQFIHPSGENVKGVPFHPPTLKTFPEKQEPVTQGPEQPPTPPGVEEDEAQPISAEPPAEEPEKHGRSKKSKE